MMLRPARWLVLPVVVVCAPACDVVEPVRTGIYNLVAVDGTTLPVIRVVTVNCDLVVEGGILDIRPYNEAFLKLYERETCVRSGGAGRTWERTYIGTYALSGSVITITASGYNGFLFEGTVERSDDAIAIDDPLPHDGRPGVLRFLPR